MSKLNRSSIFIILSFVFIAAGCGGDEPTEQALPPAVGGEVNSGIDLAIQGTLTALPSQTPQIVTQELIVEITPEGAGPPTSTATLISPADQLLSVAGTLTAVSESELAQTDIDATQTQNAIDGIDTTPAPPDCDSLRFVEDVTIADGTEMEPGEVFLKTWRIQNVGTCSWVEGYSIVFSSGFQMDGSSSILLLITIDPEEFANLSITIRAPVEPGVYRGNWMMQNADGEPFGWGPNLDLPFWVEIVVLGDTEAVPDEETPTPSPTP